jgi:hypothetical protein
VWSLKITHLKINIVKIMSSSTEVKGVDESKIWHPPKYDELVAVEEYMNNNKGILDQLIAAKTITYNGALTLETLEKFIKELQIEEEIFGIPRGFDPEEWDKAMKVAADKYINKERINESK